MTYDELLAILARTGIPWAYHHWDKPPVLPWGVYLSDGDDSFFADDRTYFLSSGIRLEVYSLTRDPALDQAVQGVLDQADIPYEMDYAYIESEGLYETIFEIEV